MVCTSQTRMTMMPVPMAVTLSHIFIEQNWRIISDRKKWPMHPMGLIGRPISLWSYRALKGRKWWLLLLLLLLFLCSSQPQTIKCLFYIAWLLQKTHLLKHWHMSTFAWESSNSYHFNKDLLSIQLSTNCRKQIPSSEIASWHCLIASKYAKIK